MNLIKINNISIFSYIVLVSSLTFLLWYLFLGFEVINQPFIWDDLHLIRPFTLAEILNSWTGNWESSGIETLSYRPIAILFYNFIGTIFGENIIFLRIFIFLLMIGLIVQFNLILFKLGLNRIQIFIFSILIVFTKIYSTLLSWAVLSGLIFCYILALSSIFLFLKWLDNKENKYYFFSIFFSFLSIFTREEMYVLPGIMVLLLIYKQKKYFMNFNKNLLITLPFFLIVLGHLLLRKVFVAEAAHFDFSLDAIKFGGEVIGFGNLSKSIKASFLPMGYWTSKNFYFLQTLTFFPWILSIIISIIISIKFLKLTNLKSIDTVIFISAIFLLCLPNITTERSFGIMMPVLLSTSFISVLISNILKIKNNYTDRKVLNTICNVIIILTFISGISGGYFRSLEHIKSMNVYSTHIIYYDSVFIYKHAEKKLKIPKSRYNKKVIHLESLNIFNMNDINNISKGSSKKIKNTKFKPLSF